MSEPKITFRVNESGRIVYKATNDGVPILEADLEIMNDIASGLYRDLKRADPEMAAMWAKAWPDVFGEAER